jgi:acetylornithine/succinyldiaminopimelate/putrescine aminotransferase
MTTTEKTKQYVLETYGRFPLTVTRGEGTRVWDELGREYLDFCSGIAVCSLGHCHPALTQAIAEQSETLMHCSNLYYIEQQADLAEAHCGKGRRTSGQDLLLQLRSGSE